MNMALNLLTLGLAAGAFLLAFFAAWRLGSRSMLRKVDSLAELAKEVACGNLTARIGQPYVSDDLGRLAASFDEMIESLQRRETKGRQVLDEMRQVNKYFENIFENSPDGIGIVDKHGMFVIWNKMACELYGYSFFGGMSAFDLYADKDELDGMLAELRREGTVKKHEVRMKKGDGSIAPFEISVSQLRDDANEIIGSVCVARDLSDIKKALTELAASHERLDREMAVRSRAEAALSESRQELANIIDFLPSFVIGLTPEHRIIRWNHAAEKIFGINGDSVMGRAVDECEISGTVRKCLTWLPYAKRIMRQ